MLPKHFESRRSSHHHMIDTKVDILYMQMQICGRMQPPSPNLKDTGNESIAPEMDKTNTFISFLTRLVHTLTPAVVDMISHASVGLKVKTQSANSSQRDLADAASRASHLSSQHPLLSDVYLLTNGIHHLEKECSLTTEKLTPLIISLISLQDSTTPSESRDSESRMSSGIIGAHDVWLLCIKVAVNLSHKSNDSILELSESGIIHDIVVSLKAFFKWRLARARHGDSPILSSQSRALSDKQLDPSLLDVRAFKIKPITLILALEEIRI